MLGKIASVLTLWLLLLCWGCSGSAGRAPAMTSECISLTVLDGTYLTPESKGTFALRTRQSGTGLEARILVQDARALKATYLELRFDPRRYQLATIKTGSALLSAARGRELLTLAVTTAPGVVCTGQVLPCWEQLPGFSGNGEIAVVQLTRAEQAPLRTISAPPVSAASAPELSFDGPNITLSWRFANQGDYNQDGMVGITDLTPLGIHYGQSVAPADINKAAAVVDGNNDGVISIGDLAPIGQNYGRNISGGWHVYQSPNAADYPTSAADDNGAAASQNVVAVDAFDASTTRAADRVLYTCVLAVPANGDHVWVRGVDTDGKPGIASNDVVLAEVNLPPIAGLSVDVASGPPALAVTLNAITSGDPDGTIEKWRYDPEGDGTYLYVPPNQPGNATLIYKYTTPGEYQPTVKVWDDKGATDTGHTHVSVSLGTPELQLLDDGNGANDVGKHPSVAMIAGKPCVAYIDSTAKSVRYIQPFTSAALGWGWPVAIADGANLSCSLAEVNGRPAVCYDGQNNNIRYIRASDSEGYDWSWPAVNAVSGAEYSLCYASLAVADGRPAIAFCDGAAFWSGDAYYVRAVNSAGSSWGVSYQINTDPYNATITSISIVNGNPAVMYTLIDGLASWGLAYTHGMDSIGSTWSASRGVGLGLEPYSSATGMQQVVGRPALAFWDELDDTLKYVRALDADGQEWGEIVSIAAASSTMYNVSLAVINTLPAIAYADSGLGLMYVQAKNTTGYSWNTPVVFDPVGGMYPDLIEVNKRAGVAHYDSNARQLRFALFR